MQYAPTSLQVVGGWRVVARSRRATEEAERQAALGGAETTTPDQHR